MTGSNYIPESNILTISSLETIEGVTWSQKCANCRLLNLKKGNISVPFTPNVNRSDPAVNFAEHGFYPFCSAKYQTHCAPKSISYPSVAEIRKKVSLPANLFYASYAMGTIAILLNLIIFLTVLSSRTLRKSTAMLLIANMALCDLLTGIYSVLIGDLNIFHYLSKHRPGEKLLIGGGVLCRVATAIFTSSQCVAAVTSLLLTVEKYCSIVHCMNPVHRLSKKVAAFLILLFWLLSLGYALAPMFGVVDLFFSATLMCSVPVGKSTEMFLVNFGILMALYIANVPLYVGIFQFVHRSDAHLGIRRETAILRKIALVVGTNFVLLLTPMILVITLVPVKNIHKFIDLSSNDRDNKLLFVFGFWFPSACFGLNACINPLLCAFRQGRFVKQIRRALDFRLLPHLNVAFFSRRHNGGSPSLSQLSSSSSQVVLYRITHYQN